MAVVEVVGELEGPGRLHPVPAVPLHAHGQGDLVHDGEADAVELVHQQVGVVAHRLQGVRAVLVVEPQRRGQGQAVLPEKLQQLPQPGEIAVAFSDLLGLPGGDALDDRQILRPLLHDLQGSHAVALHQPVRQAGAYALDDAGAEIGQNLVLRGGHVALHLLGLNLVPVDGVADPAAGDDQVLPWGGAGDGAHHGHRLPVRRHHAQHRVAVVRILENQLRNRPVDGAVPVHTIASCFLQYLSGRPTGGSRRSPPGRIPPPSAGPGPAAGPDAAPPR